MKYPRLFEPITMRGVTFQNRIQRTSMVSGLSTEDGAITEDLLKRYAREARGGVGAIVVEAAVIIPSKSPFNLRISSDDYLPGLKEVVRTIREANRETRIGIQIMQHLKLAKSGWRQRVEDFKTEDLPRIVEDHVAAARRALAAGFDFIEIHMAHAYVLSSFLSRVNRRTDGYGGSLEKRLKLPTEVFQAVRALVGETYPLGVRINGEDFHVTGNTLAQSSRIAVRLGRAGCGLHQRLRGEPLRGRPYPCRGQPARSHVGLQRPPHEPVVLVARRDPRLPLGGHQAGGRGRGFLHTRHHCRKDQNARARGGDPGPGQADMIGLCRALLCDPDWPIKAKEGRDKEIVKCAACNWCLEADSRYEKVNCTRWPEGARSLPLSPSSRRARGPRASARRTSRRCREGRLKGRTDREGYARAK